MRNVDYKVTWHVAPRQDIEITANVIAGLARLSAAREIHLDVVPSDYPLDSRHTMLLAIDRLSDGARRLAVIEVLDRADVFDNSALLVANKYFKCNFQAHPISSLPLDAAVRIRPLGLALLCVVEGSRRIIVRAAAVALTNGCRMNGLRGMRREVEAIGSNLGLLFGAVRLPEMISEGSEALQGRVVFQPRGWNETSSDKVHANMLRSELVRQLRDEFGGPERIGFMRSRVKNSIESGLYVSRRVRRRKYIAMLKSTAIGINSRGLSDSSTFKLSEYLAAGMAIVSDKMKFELPEPLVEDVNYLSYETPQDCVDRCRELMSNPARLQAMRQANREYFERNLLPENQVRYLLKNTFEQ